MSGSTGLPGTHSERAMLDDLKANLPEVITKLRQFSRGAVNV